MGSWEEDDRVNIGTDDEMIIRGFRRSYPKIILTWIGVILSCGLLLAVLSWRRRIFMKFTHKRCSLATAEKVLLIDCYNQQFVEKVERPTDSTLSSKQYTYFFNKKIKYIWDQQQVKFYKVSGLQIKNCASFHKLADGLHTTEAVFRLQHYGRNSIFVEVQPVLKLVLREIRSPFYIYQMFIVVVWMIQVYYQFALCIVLLSIISITATVWETRKQSRALKEAVRTDAIVTLLRDGKEVQKSSDELVPGDVIVLPETQFIMVCDAVLLSGNCVVNESMLTGESTPITKVPIANDISSHYDTANNKRNTLFCGTEVLHSRNVDGSGIKAIVYRTGFSTAKGELVRAILFPKPVNFKLYTELFKCMIIFFVLGIPPIIYTSIIWVHLGAYTRDTIIIVVDVLTFLVPPVLPAVLTSINAHAQRRLRKHGIYCLNSRYINFCGGLDVVCFDKTGTLTEDSLDISGVVPIDDGRFERAVKHLNHLPNSPLMKAMATCHSLSKVNGKLLGHTVDVKIFEAIGWDLEEPDFGDQVPFERVPPRIVYPQPTETSPYQPASAIAVVRQFPFESLLRRMSVVAKSQGSRHFEVYLKGAPELVSSLSKPETVPDNFKEVLEFYTRQGFRVLGIGNKVLPDDFVWDDVLRLPREELECDMQFQGLIVLQNRLKPETVPTLNVLKAADIRTIMVTGDNLLTAITVARDCGMIEEYDSVISVQASIVGTESSKMDDKPRLQIHYNYAKLPGFSEKLNMVQNGMIDDICAPTIENSNYHLAMEGTTFNLIRLHNTQLLDKMVLKGTIFARMLPEHKLYLIETLQNLGHQVGMCGDGANDCGALKTAHAGVSLSVAEASVASPFTSTQQNIQCIPMVIREGRATLSATFGAFRYMTCYCFVLLAAVLIMFWDGQKPSDGGYVVIDIVLNLLPPILFGSTEAFPGLVKRAPTRSIISFLPQFSMFSFMIIQIGVYVLAYEYCLMQPWYEPFVYNKTMTHTPAASHSGTAILSVNMMSYVIAAVIFAPGPPYRKNFTSNKTYLVVVFAEFLLVTYFTIYPADSVARFINLKHAPFIEFHLLLYVLSLANFIISYIWEIFFIQGFLFDYVVPAIRRFRGPIHKFEKLQLQMASNKKWPPVSHYETTFLRDEFGDDEIDACVTRSSIKRLQLRRQSSDIRNSVRVGLKLSKSESIDERAEETVAFVTFKEGRSNTFQTGTSISNEQNFV
ncbi:polyamine-transporting ATPase 13A3 [Parasteatoda tepidariorum]|uniref:polyamine-transporting ATPase 13A3 n=1 Tax=Parasteatoda tepidariorum TaxID=114398 RepID=UPI001C719980|nr:polyamine-transporting ATPase 13A3 isoform X2 [Parasteatoda tepidariorum]XP_042900178.1 polyamine-transporting ATPase 13A3 isoform X1 [Parasteatoda tepidariorum]